MNSKLEEQLAISWIAKGGFEKCGKGKNGTYTLLQTTLKRNVKKFGRTTSQKLKNSNYVAKLSNCKNKIILT